MQGVALQGAIFVHQQVGEPGAECDDERNRQQRNEAREIDASRVGARHAIECEQDRVGRQR